MRLLSICFLLICLAGCQKVIDVNLNSTSAKYVIVGKITDQPGDCQVSITRTKDFSEDNQFPGVSGATVTVENKATQQTRITLIEANPKIEARAFNRPKTEAGGPAQKR